MEIGSEEWCALVREGAARLGLAIDRIQADAFAVHAREMIRWNRVTNLTTITHPQDIAIKHFVDAVAPAGHIRHNSRLLDIGSGAGFPGIPLKVIRPSLQVTLIDSSRKRVTFLKHIIRTLVLQRVDVIHCRAEDAASRKRRPASFDVVICRALTDLASFVELALPLLADDGIGIALKGRTVDDELRAAEMRSDERGGRLVFKMNSYRLPLGDSARTLVIFGRGALPARRTIESTLIKKRGGHRRGEEDFDCF